MVSAEIDESHSTDGPMTPRCPVCHSAEPVNVFCGTCGAELDAKPGYWRNLLRPRVFAAAPRQPIALPLVSSTLFPRLAKPYRRPLQHALILMAIALVVFSLLRWLSPLVILTTLGVLLLFVLYLWQTNALRRIPLRALVIAPVAGAALGAGWWLWAGHEVARAYDVSLAEASLLQYTIDVGFILNTGGALILAVPVIVVRLLRVPLRDSLDGFVVGAVGALACSSAATIAWLAPQFIFGLIDNYSGGRLLEEATLYAVADPLTSAAFGGLVGIALWFRPDRRPGRRSPGLRVALAVLAVLALMLYLAEYDVDAAELPRAEEEVSLLLLTALALIALRAGMQIALLHEASGPPGGGEAACGFCEHAVPETAFCTDCGGASRASGRPGGALAT